MLERFHLTTGIICNEEQELLLVHRQTPELSQWEMPGGLVGINEKPEGALRRNLWQQIGVTVIRATLRETVMFSQLGLDYRCDWYSADVVAADVPRIQEPDTFDDTDYFSLHDLNRYAPHLSPNVLLLRKRLNDGDISLEHH